MALSWYRKASEQGYPLVQQALGWMYANGCGSRKTTLKLRHGTKSPQIRVTPCPNRHLESDDTLGDIYHSLLDTIKSGNRSLRRLDKVPVRPSLGTFSETRGWLTCHGEGAFECDPCFCQLAFFKQPSDQSHSMRHAPRGRKLRQWVVGIGRPIAPRLRNFYKPGTQCERRMSGEIGDRKHLVT